MRPSKLYPFSIPANGSVNLLVSGDYFKIKSSTGSLTVTGDSFGILQNMLAGQGLRDTNFQRLTLTDETGAVNNGFLLVSDSTFIDDRITGEVSVIDGELSRSKSGSAFSCYCAAGAVANQNAFLEIWNPPGSGKRVIVSDVSWSSNSIGVYMLNKLTASNGGSIFKAVSKSSLNTTPVSNFTFGNTASPLGVTVDLAFTPAATPFIKTFKQPYVCEPGSGLSVVNNTISQAMYAAFQFIEENV